MSAMEPPLTIKQHNQVKRALHVVDEEALHVAAMLGLSPKDHRVDDFKTIGKLALYEAVIRLDEKRSTLANFGRLRVRGAILDTVKRETRVERIELAMARAVAYRMADYWDDYNIFKHDEEECDRRLDLLVESAAVVMFAAGVEQARREADEDGVAGREEYARAIAVLKEIVLALNEDERALLDMLFGCGFVTNSSKPVPVVWP